MPVDRRHYSITGEIAKGGMGRVLDARDLRLGRAVAIKELLPKNRDLARRFEREARITARLQHPAIIHIYEAGVWVGGEPFYAMAKVSGRSLDNVIADKKTLNERLGLLPNVIAVAEALAYAHDAGVIHRDLKPANVLVGEFGQTVVIDWGLAKDIAAPEESGTSLNFESVTGETTVGSVVGTPSYMPPEQARGASVDQRADVYAIGALLYTALVGKPPYVELSHKEVLERVRTESPTPIRELEPGAPLDLAAIVEKAMDRDPEHRYADAGELAQDLRRFETGQLVAAHHYTTSQLGWRWLRRHRVAVGITTVALIALAVVVTFSVSRILADSRRDQQRREVLLEDRGRTELLAGHNGKALVFLDGAAGSDDVTGTALGFMIVEAARSFEAQVMSIRTGDPGQVIVAYSPDGSLVAAAGAGPIELWDGARLEAAWEPGITRTRAIAFDPRGEQIATGGDDGVLRVWSRHGELLHHLPAGAHPILDVAFSPDGKHAATASADGTARVWDVATWTSSLVHDSMSGPLSCHVGAVVSVRFNDSGAHLATASGNTACVWERIDGKWTMISPLRGHTGAIRTIRWNRDDHLATASEDGTARVWVLPPATPKIGSARLVIAPIGREGGPAIASAEWGPDGKRLLVADGNLAHVWRLPEGGSDLTAQAKQEAELKGHPAALTGAVFSSDGEMIATAGEDSWARVWDASTGQPILAFEHAGVVATVAFSPDRSRLVTGSRDGTARVWNLARAVEIARRGLDSPVHAVAIEPQGTVAIARDDSVVTLLRAQSDSVETATSLRGHDMRVFAAVWSPDGTQLVTAGEDAMALVWSRADPDKPIRRLGPHRGVVRSVAYSRDGRIIATAADDDDGRIRLWDASDGRAVGKLQRSSRRIVHLAFGTDLLASLDEAGELVLWDAARYTVVDAHWRLTQAAPRVVAFSHDGSRIVVSSPSDAVIYAATRTGIRRPIARLDQPTDVRAVDFSLDNSRVITASGDGVIRIWDATKGKQIGVRDAHGATLEALALSPDGDRLWAGGEVPGGGVVHTWDIRANIGTKELARALESDPWQLCDDDVVRPKGESCDDQR